MPKPQQKVPNVVPLAVWPCAEASPPGVDGLPVAPRERVAAEIARRVAETYSTPGALLAVPLGSPLATASLAAAGHRVVALAPTRRHAHATVDLARRLPGAHRNLVVRPGQPSQLRRVVGRDAGHVDLVLLLGLTRAKLRHPALLHAVTGVLRPGGTLVAVTQQRTRPGEDVLAHLVRAAAQVGLRYDQHVVALVRPVTTIAAGATAGTPHRPGRREVAHADVLVFTMPEEQVRG